MQGRSTAYTLTEGEEDHLNTINGNEGEKLLNSEHTTTKRGRHTGVKIRDGGVPLGEGGKEH